MNKAILDELRRCDNLKEGAIEGIRSFLHEDHRWILPLVFEAQNDGLLPRPCTLVMFDAHHDALEPREMDHIKEVARQSLSSAEVLDVCANHLSTNDDDWIIAGMELGIFQNAVIFGVTHNQKRENDEIYVDSKGGEHLIWMSYALPGEMMGYQGALSDLAKRDELEDLWAALDWRRNSESGVFELDPTAAPIVLDIDLDCFSAQWRSAVFTWPDEVWQTECQRVSTYFTTTGWTGRKFFDGLKARAGLFTIAREAICCGGERICDENLVKFTRNLLHGRPTFS